MAKNKVTLTLEISDDGSLKLVSKNADKTAKSINKVSKATDKAAKSQDNYNKGSKGVAGATSNSTKAFSKMSQSMGSSSGIVAAYATLAANIFAITAAFGALRQAAGLEQLEKGLIFVGNAAGQNLPKVAEGLREITGAAISTQEAMTAVAIGTSAGFSTEQLEGLTRVAKGASLALGRDMGDAMNRLTRGAAKLEPEILDELSIMVRLDDATEAYARTLGTTAANLTQFERRMAFTNAIIQQGTEKFGAITEVIDPNVYDQLSASFSDLTKSGMNLVNLFLKPIVSLLAGNSGILTGGMVLFASTISRQMVPALFKGAEAAAKASKEIAITAANSVKLIEAGKGMPKVFNDSAKAINKGADAGTELNKMLVSTNRSIVAHERGLNNLAKAEGRSTAKFKAKVATLKAVKVVRSEVAATILLQATATNKLSQAETIEATSKLNLISATKLYVKTIWQEIVATRVAVVNMTAWTATTTLFRTAINLASFSIKIFGTAVMSMIPIIGQVLFIGSILWELLSKFFASSGSVKAMDEAVEALESVEGIMSQLSKTVAESDSATKRYMSTLGVSIGVLDQVASAIKDVDAALVADALKERIRLTEELAIINAVFTDSEAWFDSSDIEDLDRVKNAIASIGEVLDKAKMDSRITLLATTISQIPSSGPLADIRRELEILQQVAEKNTDFSPAMFDRMLGVSMEAKRTIEAAIKSGGDLFNKLTDAAAKAIPKVTTPFDSIVEAVDETKKVLGKLTTDVQKAAFFSGTAQTAGLAKMREGLEAIKEDWKDLTNEQVIAKYGKNFEGVVSTMQAFKASVKKSNNALKIQRKAAKDNVSATLDLLKAEKDHIQLKVDAINAEIKGNKLTGKGAKNLQRIIQLEKERDAVVASRISDQEAGLMVARATFGEARKSIELSKLALTTSAKLLASKKQILASEIENARQKAIQSALDSDPRREDRVGLSVKEEAEIQRKFLDKKIALVREEEKVKIAGINLEFKLLEDKFKLLKAEYILYNKVLPASLKGYQEALSSSRSAATAAVSEGAETKISGLEQTVDIDKVKQQLEVISSLNEGISSYGRVLTLIAGSIGNLSIPWRQFQEVATNALKPMSDSLEALGPDGELVSLAVSGALAISDAWINVGDTFNKNTEGMTAMQIQMERGAAVANAIGQTFSQIGAIMAQSSKSRVAGIDNEIAAEKKRDGKSKESLAKISALEKKKDSEKKKAFEQDKKMKMAQTVSSTAAAVMQTLATGGFLALPLAALMTAMGAAQLAVIASSSYQGGGSSVAGGPTSVSMGERSNSVNLATANNQSGEQAFMRGERGIGSSMTNFTPAFTGVKHRASGGATTGFMVGEQGPELFIPETPGVIKPADESGSSLQSPMNVNFNISAVDATGVEELLNVQKGNIIKMIRDAANQHGEFFLETVQTESLT